jgi:hypothetical protein
MSNNLFLGRRMSIYRIYLDTSVIGGCCDKQFAEDSLRVIQGIQEGKLVALISEVILAELENAPQDVFEILHSIPLENLERIELRDEIYDLQEAYLAAGILSAKWSDDLLHVAAATVARADAMVSWNFRHIVRLDKIKAYNRINFELGYGNMTILSPREVFFDAEE